MLDAFRTWRALGHCSVWGDDVRPGARRLMLFAPPLLHCHRGARAECRCLLIGSKPPYRFNSELGLPGLCRVNYKFEGLTTGIWFTFGRAQYFGRNCSERDDEFAESRLRAKAV